VDRLVFEAMTERLLVWRCLHGGAIDASNVDLPGRHPKMDWGATRSRNVPLLRKLVATYGSCAILAWDDAAVVGTLRFYPKALCGWGESGPCFCLQQDPPAGPPLDLVEREFPRLECLEDKTLFVHCLMVVSPAGDPERYRRKGVATRMARELVRWGTAGGWTAIEANAYEEIPSLYAISGAAGRRFWETSGFGVVYRDTEPGITGEILESARRDADRVGISPGDVTNRYRMRLELRPTPAPRS